MSWGGGEYDNDGNIGDYDDNDGGVEHHDKYGENDDDNRVNDFRQRAVELRTVRVHPRVFCPRRSGLVGATIQDGRYAEKINSK